jgi:hypothetical protein
MSDQPDLFAPDPTEQERADARRDPRQTSMTFDVANHPCAVCGAPNAAYGFGWPVEPRFFCREHREDRLPAGLKGTSTPRD